MKIIAFGDIHGRPEWEYSVDFDTIDKVIFIGDYFDSKERISAEDQMENFERILGFKYRNMDKVVLLFGNHDFHYLKSTDAMYSGYQTKYENQIGELIELALNDNLMQMCYVHEHYMFTHAGVTKTWCKNNNIKDYETDINNLFRSNPEAFGFQKGPNYDRSGDNVYQSPIWVRPASLYEDIINNYIHIVGHTTIDRIMIRKEAIFIDTLGTSGEYLIIEDGVVSTKKINLI